ncbi:TMCO1/EMC3 family protein, partial [Candidatus Micrarchaeota archaeon]|nr:TMCO1/EMC3 family protein [Candidatus Micrarchaeota archaeon]MBU1940004.1 TMCO1/EMC3 family protein [Candidatus Micrarchaeota archaeon]
IVVIVFVLSVVSNILQKKFGKRDEMKAMQNTMKTHQTRMRELAGKDDHKSKREMAQIETEMAEQMGVMMSGMKRTMLISLPLWPVFFVIKDMYEQYNFPLPVPIPWFGNLTAGAIGIGIPFELPFLGMDFGIMLFSQTSWLGWYFLCFLIFSMLINKGIDFYSRRFSNADAK